MMKIGVICCFAMIGMAFTCNKNSECIGKADPDQICTMEYDPVCGCNDVTYSNGCMADAAGVKSWTKGACN